MKIRSHTDMCICGNTLIWLVLLSDAFFFPILLPVYQPLNYTLSDLELDAFEIDRLDPSYLSKCNINYSLTYYMLPNSPKEFLLFLPYDTHWSQRPCAHFVDLFSVLTQYSWGPRADIKSISRVPGAMAANHLPCWYRFLLIPGYSHPHGQLQVQSLAGQLGAHAPYPTSAWGSPYISSRV